MPSQRDNSDFKELLQDEVVVVKAHDSALPDVIDWMKKNLSPDDVFEDKELREYVGGSSLPEDVFEEKLLKQWAEDNGYVKED